MTHNSNITSGLKKIYPYATLIRLEGGGGGRGERNTQKAYFPGASKGVIVWEWVKGGPSDLGMKILQKH